MSNQPPLAHTLAEIFGQPPGHPGWLFHVPDNQLFDFRVGRIDGPAGSFVRSAASRKWVASSMTFSKGAVP